MVRSTTQSYLQFVFFFSAGKTYAEKFDWHLQYKVVPIKDDSLMLLQL